MICHYILEMYNEQYYNNNCVTFKKSFAQDCRYIRLKLKQNTRRNVPLLPIHHGCTQFIDYPFQICFPFRLFPDFGVFGPPKIKSHAKMYLNRLLYYMGMLKSNRVRVSTILSIILLLLGIPIYMIILWPLSNIRECKI